MKVAIVFSLVVLLAGWADNQQSTEHIIVQGQRIRISVNGTELVDYTSRKGWSVPPTCKDASSTAGRSQSRPTILRVGSTCATCV